MAIWDAFSKYYEIPIKNLLNNKSEKHISDINTYATGNDVKTYNELGFINYKLSVRSSNNFIEDKTESRNNLETNSIDQKAKQFADFFNGEIVNLE